MKCRLKDIVQPRSIGVILIPLTLLTILHYFTPQERGVPATSLYLVRHAVERTAFILPVAAATLVCARTGGLITLGLSILIMLPRVFLLSPYPVDAAAEVVVVAIVGYLVVRMIDAQVREKHLRQEIASRLRTVNAVTAIVSGSLELDQVLNSALEETLKVIKTEKAAAYLVDQKQDELVLVAHRGLSEEDTRGTERFQMGDSLIGQAGRSGKTVTVGDVLTESDARRNMPETQGAQSFVAVPLVAKGRVLGVMTFADPEPHRFTPQDVHLLTSIGGQVGVAIENARLYQTMRHYARQITHAQEEERKRIARDLHDETMQNLIAASRRLEGLAALPDPLPSTAVERIAKLQQLLGNTLQGLRRFVQDLRPSAIDHLGLVPALVGLTHHLENAGMEVCVHLEGDARRLPPEQELGLFRILQEGMSNARRHSGAARVVIDIAFNPGEIRASVTDDGHGFDVPDRMDDLVLTGKLGLIGMAERARLLGGDLAIESDPRTGTSITVTLPLQPAQTPREEEKTGGINP